MVARLPSPPGAQRLGREVGWRLARPALRARAARRLDRLRAGATVITVNWNSWQHLTVLLDLVAARSSSQTEVLVVDNGSVDGSRERLRSRRDLRSLLLPANLGHDLALDLGVLSCETEYAVALDVDAFPLHDGWLEELLEPLGSGAHVSGARLNRDYVHPCCWAMRTERFVRGGHSFRSEYVPREGSRDASGEVGESISLREAPHVHFFDVTSQRGPGDLGTVFGDIVYHNFYATRFDATHETTLDGHVREDDAARAWEEALERYAGPPLAPGAPSGA